MAAVKNTNAGNPFKQAIPGASLSELLKAAKLLEESAAIGGPLGKALCKQQALVSEEIGKREAILKVEAPSSPLVVELTASLLAVSMANESYKSFRGATFSVSSKSRFFCSIDQEEAASTHGKELEDVLQRNYAIQQMLYQLSGQAPEDWFIDAARTIERMLRVGELTGSKSLLSWTSYPAHYNFGRSEATVQFAAVSKTVQNKDPKDKSPKAFQTLLDEALAAWQKLAGL